MKHLPLSLTPSERSWGIRYLLFELIFLPSLLYTALTSLPFSVGSAGINCAFFLINFIAISLIFREFWKNSFRLLRQGSLKIMLTALVGLQIYWIAALAVSLLTIWLFPQFVNQNDASISAASRQNALLMGIGTVLLVPPVEEMLFRGLVFGLLHRRRRVLAYAVSTFVFCAIHVTLSISGFDPVFLLVSLAQYVPAGLVLAASYEYSGSLFAPILIHMAVNAVGMITVLR